MSGPVYPISVGDVAKYTAPSQIPAANEEYLVNKPGVMTSFGFGYIGWTKLPSAQRSLLGDEALEELNYFQANWPEIEVPII